MAAPAFKVYDADGTYQASCKEPEAAAALLAFYGPRSTIRYQHGWIMWTEGPDGCAAESYDTVASTVYVRLREHQAAASARYHGDAEARR